MRKKKTTRELSPRPTSVGEPHAPAAKPAATPVDNIQVLEWTSIGEHLHIPSGQNLDKWKNPDWIIAAQDGSE